MGTWCRETVLTTGSIIPLSRDVTMILYGLNHSGTCSWRHTDCNSPQFNNASLKRQLFDHWLHHVNEMPWHSLITHKGCCISSQTYIHKSVIVTRQKWRHVMNYGSTANDCQLPTWHSLTACYLSASEIHCYATPTQATALTCRCWSTW